MRRRLFGADPARMSPAMRSSVKIPVLLLVLAGLAVAPCAQAQTPPVKPPAKTTKPAKTAGPKAIGKFEDWTAATNKEAGQTVCYAFTRAQSSNPALSGRGDVVLTVTERAGGRDAVALSAGFAYAQNASVAVAIDAQPPLDFYTAQRSAFARDGHATVQAFLKANQLVATSPSPKGQVADTFSLKGFNAAYAAIVKACPAGKNGT
jgi:Invasion associated locus B (IalB) protein